MLNEGKKDEEVLAVLWAGYVAEFDTAYREEEVFLHRWVKPTFERRNMFIWREYAARKGKAACPYFIHFIDPGNPTFDRFRSYKSRSLSPPCNHSCL